MCAHMSATTDLPRASSHICSRQCGREGIGTDGGLVEISSQVKGNSHLTGRDELQRSESDLEVGSVCLEIVQSTSNAGLQLGGVLPRRAVGGDLVQRGRHAGRRGEGNCRQEFGLFLDGRHEVDECPGLVWGRKVANRN